MSTSDLNHEQPQVNENGSYSAEVMICNIRGLHARASAKFVKTAGAYTAKVKVTRCGETVGGTSIMGLMMLAASKGCTILIESEGPQAKEAMNALIELVADKFHEDE